MKTVGGLRRTRYRGVERTGLAGYFVATAYNLVRMANLGAVGEDSCPPSGRDPLRVGVGAVRPKEADRPS